MNMFKKQERVGILNVLLFSFFFLKKKCTKKSFFSVQSNIKTKEAEYFQRDMEAIKTLKYCTFFCLVYNKTRKCCAIERGRCLRTQTHEIFNTSILYYNWFHWDLNPTKKNQNRWSSKLQTKIKMIWILIVMGHIHLL